MNDENDRFCLHYKIDWFDVVKIYSNLIHLLLFEKKIIKFMLIFKILIVIIVWIMFFDAYLNSSVHRVPSEVIQAFISEKRY